MFKNIGQTLRSVASIVAVMGIFFSVVIGGIMAGGDVPVIGIVIIIVGSLSSLIYSLILDGLGQLIQNTDILVKNTDRTSDQQGAQYTQYAVQKPDGAQKLMNVPTNLIKVGTCELCGKTNIKTFECNITLKDGTHRTGYLCQDCLTKCNSANSQS